MRLFISPTSPFVSKVRMAAHHCGVVLDCQAVDTGAEPADLLSTNPLGKIPALVLDDGRAVFDSRVICEYFDRASGGHRLIPQEADAWLTARTTEAIADGIMDAVILTVYESRFRPEEKRHQPWVDKQWRKAHRGLNVLDGMVGKLPAELNVGHFAVGALLGYLDLRFKGTWEADNPRLAAWLEAFPSVFPAFQELRPKAA